MNEKNGYLSNACAAPFIPHKTAFVAYKLIAIVFRFFKSDRKEAPKFFCLFLQLINRWNLIQFYNHLFRFLFIIIYRSLRLIFAQWLLIMSPDKLLENPWIIAERKDFWRERKIATEVILYDFDSDPWHQMNFHLLLWFEWIVAVSFNKICITNICRFVNYS